MARYVMRYGRGEGRLPVSAHRNREEKEGIRFTLHLSDLFSSVAIEGGSMESGCRFSNGITGRSAAPDAPG